MSINLLTERRILADISRALEAGDLGWVDRLSLKTQSDQGSELYAGLGASPAMREWLGGRSVKDLREYSFSIVNKEYEASIEVTVPEMRRAKTSIIQQRIQDLATRVSEHPAKLLSTLMIAAESTNSWDSQFYFDTDHAEGDSGTQSNDLTYTAATGTTPTVDEMKGAIIQSVVAISGFKDDRGEPLNQGAREFMVMVPWIYYEQAIAACNLAQVPTGGPNLLQNLPGIRIYAQPNLYLDAGGWTTKFATFRTDGAAKPFILQEEAPLSIKAIAEGSELEFNENKHRYGVDWAGNVGLYDWRCAALTTFT